MNHFSYSSPHTVRYNCLHYGFDKLFNLFTVKKTLEKDLEDSKFTYDNLVGKNLIIDFRAEGQRPEDIKYLIEYLSGIVPIEKILVVFNAVVRQELPYKYVNANTFLLNFGNIGMFSNEENILTIDKKFICLNHRASLSRARFLSGLFKIVGRENVRASFGANLCPSANEYRPFFDEPFPILLDAPPVNPHKIDEQFKTCLFNIIPESSSQSDANIWKSIFITEKTFKCFKMLQIPIWFAVPGLVSEVRNLGFDVFDDIIDHSYDSIQDETIRMNQVLKIVEDLDKQYRLKDCIDLRNRLLDRMLNNRQLLNDLWANQPTTQEIEKML